MTLESVWPAFVLIGAAMVFVALPLFGFLDEPAGRDERWSTIDGLRGFLALGVFVFHLIVVHRYILTGVWAPPDSKFYALLGPVGVSVFFMLTGFLFWSKLLRSQGRPAWKALYVGRLFRIGPMYLVVVLAMFAVVAARSGFEWREPPGVVAGELLQWLALGFIDSQPDINGQATKPVLAGVTWTLWYEWAYYLSLVVIAVFARQRTHLAFSLAALLLCLAGKRLWQVDALGFAALFAIGMAVASLLHAGRRPKLPAAMASAAALLCLAAPFLLGAGGYGTLSALCLAGFFYFVCSGSSLFGLLHTTAAQRLGRISYSLYLMQGLALTAVFGIAPLRAFALQSPAAWWAAGGACAGLLVAAAALGYAAIEKPGIALGRRLLQRTVNPVAVNAT